MHMCLLCLLFMFSLVILRSCMLLCCIYVCVLCPDGGSGSSGSSSSSSGSSGSSSSSSSRVFEFIVMISQQTPHMPPILG